MTDAVPERQPTAKDWLAIAGGMVGCFMAILDIQITNSSLAQIEGSIGASIDEGSWIATAYLVAEIVVIPLTGWLSIVFGLRRYLAASTTLFILFSIACAWSTNLNELILFRAGQGFTGGALIPTGLTIITRQLPPSKQMVGGAIFGVGVTFAPSLGPTLGGWLTENLSWHYIFYLNVIPGLVAIALQLYALAREPVRLGELIGGDWWGILTMTAGLGAVTVVLEEGQRRDWLSSPLIRDLAIVAVVSFTFFLIVEFTSAKPVLNLRLLSRHGVGSGNFLSAVIGAVSYGSIFLVPLYLSQVPRYSAMQMGSVVMWSGLPQLLVFPLMPLMVRYLSLRPMVAVGSLLVAASCFLNANLSPQTSGNDLIFAQVLRAVGFPIFAMPMLQLTVSDLPGSDAADASSLTNVFRNLGGSIGIAMLATMTQGREQVHFTALAERVSANAGLAAGRLQLMAGLFLSHAPDLSGAEAKATAMLARQMHQQALVLAYVDAFNMLGVLMLLCLPLILLLPKGSRTMEAAVH